MSEKIVQLNEDVIKGQLKALTDMYLTGVSVRRVEDITKTLRGCKISSSTISEMNKKA